MTQPSKPKDNKQLIQKIKNLSQIIDEVFLPCNYNNLSPNNTSEQRNVTQRFSKVMHHTVSQLESEFSFDLVTLSGNPAQLASDPSVVSTVENQLHMLTAKIQEVLAEIEGMKDKRIHKPVDEIKFWKNKGAKLTKAHKLVEDARVRLLEETLDCAVKIQTGNPEILESYQRQLEDLQREQTKVKEDENLVATLERHFAMLDSDAKEKGLDKLADPIRNLITHLKLVWTNTKHFHKDIARFKLILDSVEREICLRIRNEVSAKLRSVNESKFDLEGLMKEVKCGAGAAHCFKDEYLKTKKRVKEDNQDNSWDESADLFVETNTLQDRLHKMAEKFEVVDLHSRLIDHELTTVIGDANFLKNSKRKTYEMFEFFQAHTDRLFAREREQEFDNLLKDFEAARTSLDEDISKAIQDQFSSVRSSIDKFKMLEKFKNINSVLKDADTGKFGLVLDEYTKTELKNQTDLFYRYMDNPPVSDDIPEFARKLIWAKQLYHRGQAPFAYLAKNQEKLGIDKTQKDTIIEAFKKFRRLFQDDDPKSGSGQIPKVYEAWKANGRRVLSELSKKKIIKEVKIEGSNDRVFEVEMIDEVIMFIKEAKQMDSLGFELARNIQNLVLNEERQQEEINGLKFMLNDQNEILRSFNDFEKKTIMKEQLADLAKIIHEGTLKDWKSINKKTYIDRCTGEINRINKNRLAILKELTSINSAIAAITKVDVVRQSTHANSMAEFVKIQNEEVSKSNVLLGTQMDAIKAACNIIEFNIKTYNSERKEKGSSGSSVYSALRMFKFWVEVRILNALIRAIGKGLNILAVMFCFTEKMLKLQHFDDKLPWLFKVSVSAIMPDVILDPMPKDVVDGMKALVNQVQDLSKNLPRFKDVVPGHKDKDAKSTNISQFNLFADGDNQDYPDLGEYDLTFFGDTSKHKILNWLKNGLEYYLTEDNLNKIKQELTTRKESLKLNEAIELEDLKSYPEKFLTTPYIERQMYKFKLIYDQFKELQETSDNLVRKEYQVIDLKDFNQEVMNKALENLQKQGRQLLLKAQLEQSEFKSKCEGYQREVTEEPQDKDAFKKIKERLNQIKSISHPMQIRMYHIRERIRTFFMYLNQDFLMQDPTDHELINLMLEIKTIYQKWGKIVDLTHAKIKDMTEQTKIYAQQTKEEDVDYRKRLEDFYNEFEANGPHCKGVDLQEGLIKFKDFSDRVEAQQNESDKITFDQELFGIDKSKHEHLSAVQGKLKHVKKIFAIFELYKKKMEEFNGKYWKEFSTKDLRHMADDLPKRKRKELPAKEYDLEPQFKNLSDTIEDLKLTTDLIECLRIEGVKDLHFIEIAEEAGVQTNTDIKTMIVEDVLRLQLSKHEEFVREVAVKAKKQEELEKDILKIETTWKEQAMNILRKERDDKVVFLLSGTDDIRQKLEDDQNQMSGMGSDRGLLDNPDLKHRLKTIEEKLTEVTETVDQWTLVQSKYMNLEIIFKNDEIKTQLKAESREFMKLDKEYTKIAETAQNNKMILGICNKGTFTQLVDILKGLENCQRNLSKQLDDKKTKCPRFYFVSNDDLLCILGSQDPKVVQDFLSSKLFDNAKKLLFTPTTQIEGMVSEEDETFKFGENVKPEGKVENWLNSVEFEMVKSLKKLCKEGIYWYSKTERPQWLTEHLGMVVIAAETVWWSWRVEDTFAKIKAGNKKGMKLEFQKQQDELEALTDMLVKTNDKKLRLKLNILITCSVHSRDIVGDFVRDSILDVKEFQWESQLRFYFDNDTDIIRVNQCTWVYQYCYEQQGLKDRLVITPLTDRCIMTLTTAMKFFLGGAPAGPAGTGKTESVKDLAKNLAVRCVVTNCGETMTKQNLANIQGGLASAGFWGCFDEFNRINEEVLSVAATQVAEIQDALRKNKDVINFDGMRITMRTTVALFITMNPTQLGRTELPDNLKVLFRPMTMIVPDIDLICEIKLMSEGFKDARGLASKMAKLQKLCDEKLSKQQHYDFGLRTLKAALVMAGELKRDDGKRNEFGIIMKALRDMNTPRFTYEDQILFFSLIEGLFANVDIKRTDFPPIMDTVIKVMDREDRRNAEYCEEESNHIVSKTIHLQETMQTRHTTMIVGPTCAGKTTIIETLKTAKTDDGTKTRIGRINPKDRSVHELQGEANPDTGDWVDGLLSKIQRQFNDNRVKIKNEEKWIVFDGDIDAKWIEDMNSVMDDSKLLTLSGSDRIMLLPHCKLILEVDDLAYSSKATISRCGVVQMDNALLGQKLIQQRWCKWGFNESGDKRPDKVREQLEAQVDTLIDPLVKQVKEGLDEKEKKGALQEVQPKTELNLVRQACNLMDVLMEETRYQESVEEEVLNKIFVFAMTWGMGGCLEFGERKKFFEKFKNLLDAADIEVKLPGKTQFDFFVEVAKVADGPPEIECRKWAVLKSDYKPPDSGEFSKILVPTEETAKYQYILKIHVERSLPICIIGESGVSKTVITKGFLKTLDNEQNTLLSLNYSSSTKSIDFYNYVMEFMEKDVGKQMKPKGGKTLCVYIDDMSMPKKDPYNTQQVIALMRFLFENKFFWERSGALDQIHLKKIKQVMNMLPPGGGRNSLDPRFITQINSQTMYESGEDTKIMIYKEILKGHIDKYWQDKKLVEMCKNMATMTVRTFDDISKKLSRTPIKFHYIFNLRDINKIYEGIMQATIDNFPGVPEFVRLWRHEMIKVVSDRLMTVEDRKMFGSEIIPDAIKKEFGGELENAMKDPIIFGDFLHIDPNIDMGDQERFYKDCSDYETVKPVWQLILDTYNEENPPMELVMFDQALYHMITVSRVLRMPRGNALMIGVGGSGKNSTCRLATFSSGMKLFTLTLARNQGLESLLENLKELQDGVLSKPKVFMFNDSHVVQENFIEIVNTVITNAMVQGLYADNEKDELMRSLRADMKREGIHHSEEWNYYLERLKDNLHMCLCFSPAGDTLRERCRNFPGMIANSTIDWFFEWPEDALIDVANFKLAEFSLDETIKPDIIKQFAKVHVSVNEQSKEYLRKLKRINQTTPKHFLNLIIQQQKTLERLRKIYEESIKKYKNGVAKIIEAEGTVKVKKGELSIEMVELQKEKEKVQKLIEEINVSKIETEEATQQAQVLNVQIAAKVEEVNLKNENAKVVMAESERVKIEIESEVKENLKAEKIKALQGIINKPPMRIQLIVQAAGALCPTGTNEGATWPGCQGLVAKAGDFFKGIDTFMNEDGAGQKLKQKMVNNCEDQLNKLHKDCVADPKFKGDPKNWTNADMGPFIKTVSSDAFCLWQWAGMMSTWYTSKKKFDEQSELVEKATKELNKAKSTQAETEEKLARLTTDMARMEKELAESKAKLADLEENLAIKKANLEIAEKLVNGLGDEKVSWRKEQEQLNIMYEKLVGDALLSCTFLTYLGPFESTFRREIMANWVSDISNTKIPQDQEQQITTFLATEVEKTTWESEGLSADTQSTENGILTLKSSRQPLCIDPQMQALTWIKKSFADKNLKIKSMNDDYSKLLEIAVKQGTPFMFENVTEDIDPMVAPILEQNQQYKSNAVTVNFNGSDIEVNENFRMYLMTKVSNPKFTPENFAAAVIINYSVTPDGLKEQLLNRIVDFENSDLERRRKENVEIMSRNKREKKELEDELLKELSKEGDLLQNTELVKKLEESKTKSTLINRILIEAKESKEKIDKERLSYELGAIRGQVLYFALDSLSEIEQMYNYSLSQQINLFDKALRNSKPDKNSKTNRLKYIINKNTEIVQFQGCLGLFEKHKLMFSFHIASRIQINMGKMDEKLFNFLLRGNTSLDPPKAQKTIHWLSDQNWKDLELLSLSDKKFATLLTDITENETLWRAWQDDTAPEDAEMPCGYSQLPEILQKICILKVFRIDRLKEGISQWVVDKMGADQVKPKQPNINEIYSMADNKTPILQILSPGADPRAEIIAKKEELEINLFEESLGQGSEEKAEDAIKTAIVKGTWVFLQNCHLLKKWLPLLDRLLDSEPVKKAHKDFRLWLTTKPTPVFPLGILHKSNKVVAEPPDGLDSNLRSTWSKMNPKDFDTCSNHEFKPLVYTVSFFHAVIQERKKFGKIGWNIMYDFNESDFSVSIKLLNYYLGKSFDDGDEQRPWGSIKYLIGEAMYGGRVTDGFDRRVLNTYLNEYLGDFVFDEREPFQLQINKQRTMKQEIPFEESSITGQQEQVFKTIPTKNPPTVFGLNVNAEIIQNANFSNNILMTMLMMQSSDGDSDESGNVDELVKASVTDINTKLQAPQEFDKVKDQIDNSVDDKMDPKYYFTAVVLKQEIERINMLIKCIKRNLKDINDVISGFIGMSSNLETIYNDIYNGFIPEDWKKLSPQTNKKLASWMIHLRKRVDQFNEWIKGEPNVTWLSGIHVPYSYMVALCQQYCKENSLELDKLVVDTKVTKFTDVSQVTSKPKSGRYISGMFIEGARFDIERQVIKKQQPKVLIQDMPILHVEPVLISKLKTRDRYMCPTQVTSSRTNNSGEGFVYNAYLPTRKHESHWILQGVAMVLNDNE